MIPVFWSCASQLESYVSHPHQFIIAGTIIRSYHSDRLPLCIMDLNIIRIDDDCDGSQRWLLAVAGFSMMYENQFSLFQLGT